MKLKFHVILVVVFLLCGGTSIRAQQPPADPTSQPTDPIGENLIPPDLLIRNSEALGLNEEQVKFFRGQMEKMGAHMTELQQRLGTEMEALSALLKPDHPDESKVLAQLDKVLDVEHEIKRTHLSLIVQIKNELTPEQLTKAIALKDKWVGLASHLQAKLQQVHAGVQRWQEEGRDPSAVREIMQDFSVLMDGGKPEEAEAVLDKALEVLAKE